jgi:hypothetical protein
VKGWIAFVRSICNINQIMSTSVNWTNFANLFGKFCQISFYKKLKRK